MPIDQPTASPTPLLNRLWKSWGENLRILAIALALALFIRTFIAEPRFIPSASMCPLSDWVIGWLWKKSLTIFIPLSTPKLLFFSST